MAWLQSTIASFGRVDEPCVIEDTLRFLVGPPSYVMAFRRPNDGRLHRVYYTGTEVGKPE